MLTPSYPGGSLPPSLQNYRCAIWLSYSANLLGWQKTPSHEAPCRARDNCCSSLAPSRLLHIRDKTYHHRKNRPQRIHSRQWCTLVCLRVPPTLYPSIRVECSSARRKTRPRLGTRRRGNTSCTLQAAARQTASSHPPPARAPKQNMHLPKGRLLHPQTDLEPGKLLLTIVGPHGLNSLCAEIYQVTTKTLVFAPGPSLPLALHPPKTANTCLTSFAPPCRSVVHCVSRPPYNS